MMIVLFSLLAGISSGTGKYLRMHISVQGSFLMPVEDIFNISGRGTVFTGTIERGDIKMGDTIEIVGSPVFTFKSRIRGINIGAQTVSEAKQGDKVGLLLSGIDISQVSRGMVIAAPGSIHAYTEFDCSIHLFTKDEGGRSTPVFDKYRPQFVFWTNTVTGEINLSKETESLKPGDDANVSVKLMAPSAMENNMEFIIREGGRTVGKGKLIKIIQ